MRVSRTWVPPVAKKIIDHLVVKDMLTPSVPIQQLLDETEHIMLEELSLEDRLNAEVRELLKKFESEIDKGNIDYRKVFDLTKQKLVRERELIL